MESDRPRRPSLARGSRCRAPRQHAGMAAGAVVPGSGRAPPGAGALGTLSAGGHVESVAVHPGRTHPRYRPVPAPGRAAGVSSIALQDLRRIVAAVARLRGETVRDVTVRSDMRHVKVELESGLILVVSAERDQHGRPYLEVDVVAAPHDASARQQIEVRFD